VSTAPGRILVVDDNRVNRLLLTRTLELQGHDVASCDDGRAALDMLRREDFDILLLDIEMPGMNGFEVLEQARRIRPGMACMLMTAHGTPDIINEATRLGFDYILLKPFTPSELRGAVDKVLASKA